MDRVSLRPLEPLVLELHLELSQPQLLQLLHTTHCLHLQRDQLRLCLLLLGLLFGFLLFPFLLALFRC